ncbi:hypothetical protein AMET1_0566 [Methanonatronarchaeum thermophilum]|uniref:Uncharacterized protein n=1 Tax=Methanonatronarchaeum thermophilum TaxID=1927129 RepID=A0A1Y3GHK2_9EURY|nr:hypothetical protein [Methanonatronarchaeum thermophilum]OUJ18915.1 hypothetical protein AMET1_0566 [Methanonatronarchaeum thermophilum]
MSTETFERLAIRAERYPQPNRRSQFKKNIHDINPIIISNELNNELEIIEIK